jgi:TP901-1 family phage major tail protein
MAKQLGRAMLIKIGDGADPETFAYLAGINSKTLTINNAAIDATTADESDPGGELWAQSLNGLKSVSVSGDGIFIGGTDQEERLNAVAEASDPIANFEVIVPDFGTYAGEFRVTTSGLGGETEGAVTFSLALESTGFVAFLLTGNLLLESGDVILQESGDALLATTSGV